MIRAKPADLRKLLARDIADLVFRAGAHPLANG
jgi:hypothetical protein